MTDELENLLVRVTLALGIGLLIGLERGWRSREAAPGSRTAGVRTFAISGLLGGIVGAMAKNAPGGLEVAGGILLGAATLAYAAIMLRFGRDQNRAAHTFSATTTVAGLLTFELGAYALLGDARVAAAAGIAAAGVLVAREALHEWLRRITLAEIESALLLLAMTFIALPIVPNSSVAALGGVNPREIWIIAIVLAAVSFAGYIAVKVLGERRGVLAAAATGGLVSSTAVVLANARRAATGEGSVHMLMAGAALASAVSFLRVAVIVFLLGKAMIPLVGPPLLAVSLVAAGLASVYAWRPSVPAELPTTVRFRNPFGFFSVIALALSMAVLVVVGKLVYQRYGGSGALASAVAMGVFDVDAMTVSMAKLLPRSGDVHGPGYAVLAGVASNSLGKLLIGALVGRGRFGLQLALMSAACLIAGALSLLLTRQLLYP